MIMDRFKNHELIYRAKNLMDEFLRRYKIRVVLFTIAKACFVSTFVEDAYRMWDDWDGQLDHVRGKLRCSHFVGTMFVILNLAGQLVGSGLVLMRLFVAAACAILFGILCFHTFAYPHLWNQKFLFSNASLCGALLLVLAESWVVEARSMDKCNTYFQLIGRILVVSIFITVLQFDFHHFSSFLQTIIAIVLMGAVTVGFKARLSALILFFWLSVLNSHKNAFWNIDSSHAAYDFVMYDFFKTLSLIGGLLMIVLLGPGGLSVDNHNSQFLGLEKSKFVFINNNQTTQSTSKLDQDFPEIITIPYIDSSLLDLTESKIQNDS